MPRILITGTSKGIGYDTTLLLARAGNEVAATMRNPGACDLEKVAAEAKLPVTALEIGLDSAASGATRTTSSGCSRIRESICVRNDLGEQGSATCPAKRLSSFCSI